MTFPYISVDEAISRKGLRMVVVGGVPSPWGEAAKGVFHIKGIEWAAVRLDYASEALREWSGARNGPVAVFNDERPRAGWADILMLAERLAPAPSLLPADPGERALALGLAHELLGEGGLAWSRRLQLVQMGLDGAGGGFGERVAKYLGKRYGHSAEAGAAAPARVFSLLGMFAGRLAAQRAAGSAYYLGNNVSVVDVYSAACMALFAPLAPDVCAMDAANRAAFETRDPPTAAALAPILLEHRDMMYAKHLELPLAL